jgi:hypothetical protein
VEKNKLLVEASSRGDSLTTQETKDVAALREAEKQQQQQQQPEAAGTLGLVAAAYGDSDEEKAEEKVQEKVEETREEKEEDPVVEEGKEVGSGEAPLELAATEDSAVAEPAADDESGASWQRACRFFVKGRCRKGKNCPFKHDVAAQKEYASRPKDARRRSEFKLCACVVWLTFNVVTESGGLHMPKPATSLLKKLLTSEINQVRLCQLLGSLTPHPAGAKHGAAVLSAYGGHRLLWPNESRDDGDGNPLRGFSFLVSH